MSPARLALVALALLLAAGAAFAAAPLRHHWLPKRWAEVEDAQLYRSGQLSRRLVRETLERHGVRVVVDLDDDRPGEPDPAAELRAVEALGIDYRLLPLRGDGTGELEHYARAIQAIEGARRSGLATLVHCSAGARRSGGVVAAYLLLVRGASPDAAYRELDRYGSPVGETPLVDWLNRQLRPLAERLVARGVIDRVPDPLPRLRPRGAG